MNKKKTIVDASVLEYLNAMKTTTTINVDLEYNKKKLAISSKIRTFFLEKGLNRKTAKPRKKSQIGFIKLEDELIRLEPKI